MDNNTILTNTKNKKPNILPLSNDFATFIKQRITHKKEMKLMYGPEYNHIYDGYLLYDQLKNLDPNYQNYRHDYLHFRHLINLFLTHYIRYYT